MVEEKADSPMDKYKKDLQEKCEHICAQSMVPSNVWVGGFPKSITVGCTICTKEKVYVPEVKDELDKR